MKKLNKPAKPAARPAPKTAPASLTEQELDEQKTIKGQAISQEKLQGLSLLEVVRWIESLIRSDYGGKDPGTVVQAKMKKHGYDIDRDLAMLIVHLCAEMIEGCRERVRPRLQEIRRRATDQPALKVIRKAA